MDLLKILALGNPQIEEGKVEIKPCVSTEGIVDALHHFFDR